MKEVNSMKLKSIGILSISLFAIVSLLSSCQFTPVDDRLPVNLASDQFHTLIFSSNRSDDVERFYYEALLTLQKKYPTKLDSIKIIKKENDKLISHYQINTFPTIIVLDGKEEITRLEGKRKVKAIESHLEAAYTK